MAKDGSAVGYVKAYLLSFLCLRIYAINFGILILFYYDCSYVASNWWSTSNSVRILELWTRKLILIVHWYKLFSERPLWQRHWENSCMFTLPRNAFSSHLFSIQSHMNNTIHIYREGPSNLVQVPIALDAISLIVPGHSYQWYLGHQWLGHGGPMYFPRKIKNRPFHYIYMI
jgi:hypothetical protein